MLSYRKSVTKMGQLKVTLLFTGMQKQKATWKLALWKWPDISDKKLAQYFKHKWNCQHLAKKRQEDRPTYSDCVVHIQQKASWKKTQWKYPAIRIYRETFMKKN